MMSQYRRHAFSSYLTRLLSEGRLVFTSEKGQDELGLGKRAFIADSDDGGHWFR